MAKLNTKIVMLEGEQGKDGTNIKSVEKSASDGLTDTYTITLTDGSKSSFNVTNGKGITSISKTGAIGLDDIYTITYNDETTSTFTVPNGKATDLVQSQIVPTASIEIGATASKAYSVGDFLVKDGILYKVTKAIAKDDALTVGDNIASETIAEGLNSIQSQIVPTASIEVGETASKAYNVGDFLVKDGVLYKVTNAIAKDDALTVGTNIVMTTVGGELSSIKSDSTDKWTFKKLTGTDNNVTVPSGVKEFYLCGVNVYQNVITSTTIPIELFNYDEILHFYAYLDGNKNVYIMRTSTENVYAIHCVGLAFAIFGYR